MSIKENMDWVINLGDMTIYNINFDTSINIEKKGKAFSGKINNAPGEVLNKWARKSHGERIVKKLITEAEKEFKSAYIESNALRKAAA